MLRTITLALLSFAFLPVGLFAQAVSADDQAFIDKHVSEIVKITPTKMEDANVAKVFAAPFFKLDVEIQDPDGSSEGQSVIVARVGDKLVNASRPDTTQDLPNFSKTVNPSFKLATDDDAKTMQAAFDALYPIASTDDQKVEGFKHSGNEWTFIRGKFFQNSMGFVVDTDASGVVTGAKFSLQLP
ncbi:MAG TPA: hypothetical protein VMD30_00155 [Tepidisphaeraceae bacterium]|nr:hypothetical protein [Tepidisphaeraceae bacterium]